VSEVPPRISALSALVNDRLEVHLGHALDRLRAMHPDLDPLADELRAFVADGGKRLRPVLVLLGHQIAGGDPDDAVGPALAVELLHTCALLHDDLIDAADTRRGRPATHVAFAARHRDLGYGGDPDRFGAAIAILLGDLAFVQADEAFLTATLPDDRVLAGFRTFNDLREEVMAGQSLDVIAAAARSTDLDKALSVATLKSGRYSVTRPLQLGAVLAGAGDDVVSTLLQVGDPLGLAFQLRDDLLGVFGELGETGKPVAGDLAEGKRTVLIAEAAARLPAHDGEVVERALGRSDLADADAERVRGLLVDCGAVDAVTARIADLAERARAATALLPPSTSVQDLEAFVDWFVTRRT
jgi:geranylgeranyl diphosphate synthase type I